MGNICVSERKSVDDISSTQKQAVPSSHKDEKAVMSTTAATTAATAAATAAEASASTDDEARLSLDSDVDDVVDDMPEPSAASGAKKQRKSVSAEAYGEWNKRESFVAPVYKKTVEQKARIAMTIEKSFLFDSLDKENLSKAIDAFQELNIAEGITIITQGDDGDKLYLIEEGTVEVFKKASDNAVPQFMCTMLPGDTFGELALMYNAPRAATVTSKTAMKLWGLDRESFVNIVRDAASQQREMYDTFLKEVPLLKDMEPYARSKIADALKPKDFGPNEVMIKQGDAGDIFYMMTGGTAVAHKDGVKVKDYEKGGYFGELALLFDQPRAASVTALEKGCSTVYMDRRSFKRLLSAVHFPKVPS
eukprot:GHVS01031840.1.p1 GENE.GHVS01031840.1~~GHVS01031840.1.p1  ORF type:complete len:363 (+),score=69.12 GHVS01031840.1:96-1184(+)